MSEQKKQANFSFRYQPSSDSTDAVLLDYLKNHAVLDTKTLILDALRAFWLPFAYQESPEYTDEQVKRIGWHCIFTLLNHIERICCILELDRTQLEIWAKPGFVRDGSRGEILTPKVENHHDPNQANNHSNFTGLNMLSYQHPLEDEDE